MSEIVSRDLWGITIDCTLGGRQAEADLPQGEAGRAVRRRPGRDEPVPPQWRASEHERLLAEIAEIGRQIASLRGGSKSLVREQLQMLEAAKQEKWDAIRALWAGDGGWHKKNGNAVPASGRRQPRMIMARRTRAKLERT